MAVRAPDFFGPPPFDRPAFLTLAVVLAFLGVAVLVVVGAIVNSNCFEL